MQVRIATVEDRDAIESLHRSAFDEAESAQVAELAAALLETRSTPLTLSLVSTLEERVTGHVAFSPVKSADEGEFLGYILAPLGVHPDFHAQGVGSLLVETGLERLTESGTKVFFVYGDPAYYGRFGFTAEAAASFAAPFPLEHPFGWQARVIGEERGSHAPVRIACVEPLNDPGLW